MFSTDHLYPPGATVSVLDQRTRRWKKGVVLEREITETMDGTSLTWKVNAPRVRKGPVVFISDPAEIRSPVKTR